MDPTYYGWKQKEKSGGTNWQIMKYKTVLKHSPQIDYVRISVHAHNTPITSGEIKMLAIMFVWKLYCMIERW
jgi:hypothetical protein